MPGEPSRELADYVSSKIDKRRLADINVSDLKETYKDYLNRKNDSSDLTQVEHTKWAHLLKNFKKQLQDDKRSFSYNPYRLQNRPNTHNVERPVFDRKRVSFEKK